MSARAVSAPLAQLPNALTILRLALIPAFVALLVPADGGYSWPAAVVFAVAGITDQALRALSVGVAESVLAVLAGRRPERVVNPAALT